MRCATLFGSWSATFGLAAALAVTWGCREKLPNTPGLEMAKKHHTNATSKASRHLRIKHEDKHLRKYLSGGQLVLTENFDRKTLGSKWKILSNGWVVRNGELANFGAHNKGAWWLEPLPQGDVRIEFSVRSVPKKVRKDGKEKTVFEGDIKCEGLSRKPEPRTGYVFIFGGWKNTINRIARIEEHAKGKGALVVDGPPYAVKPNTTYQMKVLRVGSTLAWYADDKWLAHYTDPNLIRGRYFSFNNWAAHVYFDNVRVYSLNSASKPTHQ